jgi:hypothetical protein
MPPAVVLHQRRWWVNFFFGTDGSGYDKLIVKTDTAGIPLRYQWKSIYGTNNGIRIIIYA